MLTALVIDDDDDIRFAVRRVVSKCGCNVSDVESGEKALAMMNSNTYDIVFCDLRFPGGMPGEELLKQLNTLHPEIKVILMSCAMDAQIKNKLLELGASDCVRKPFFKDVCLETIENLYPHQDKAA